MIVFKVIDELGSRVLEGVQSWEEVPRALYDNGLINSGKVRVHMCEYQLLCTTPQIIDTTYKS